MVAALALSLEWVEPAAGTKTRERKGKDGHRNREHNERPSDGPEQFTPNACAPPGCLPTNEETSLPLAAFGRGAMLFQLC